VIWLCGIAKRSLVILQQPIAKHMLMILVTLIVELVAFIGLGGVNNVFSHVLLILVPTFSIFVKCYVLISSRLSWLHGNPISCLVSCTIGTPS
jgi:hypothetical protein